MAEQPSRQSGRQSSQQSNQQSGRLPSRRSTSPSRLKAAATLRHPESWDANWMMLREWSFSVAGAAVLLLFELAFQPPLTAPVDGRAAQM